MNEIPQLHDLDDLLPFRLTQRRKNQRRAGIEKRTSNISKNGEYIDSATNLKRKRSLTYLVDLNSHPNFREVMIIGSITIILTLVVTIQWL